LDTIKKVKEKTGAVIGLGLGFVKQTLGSNGNKDDNKDEKDSQKEKSNETKI
jgi:hypothetical protein